MLLVFQVLPLGLDSGVTLHVNVGFAPLETVFLIDRNKGVEKEGVGTL